MGESFLGIPNRFRNIDNLLEKTYNPNHMLSAHMGYELYENFHNYLPLSGGSIIGLIGTQDIIPNSVSTHNIGNTVSKYLGIYADAFYGELQGNATSASKLQTPITIKLLGSVTGEVMLDGSTNVEISTSTNHNHDSLYLRLSGGTLSGNMTLGKGAAILDSFNRIILSENTNDVVEINSGGYAVNKGATVIYSAGDVDLRTQSAGIMITSALTKKTVNVGTAMDSVYVTNTTGNDYLHLTDNHKLLFNDNEVYHRGNFNPENLLTTEYKDHINSVKKVIKVITILLDQLEVQSGVKDERDYPDSVITDQLEYYKKNAITILDEI